ncbi:DUF5908 family protein [Variovorax sp. IB41]|jgi:Family of unknown function (DUF5908)|uniref:DUF5908 family protein n=1 Tax=Variovorax sp. IB41 TaxID=2779370 RepID=UPI0018E8EA1F|nr:DUF5908 family protein [Variovorax sp. IB41]MBJ2155436.1 hypothetical protein [Variovorax sp. IB41]
MPIVVDEVVITVEVGNAAGGGTATPPAPADDRQSLVAECVERVLEILRDREEP